MLPTLSAGYRAMKRAFGRGSATQQTLVLGTRPGRDDEKGPDRSLTLVNESGLLNLVLHQHPSDKELVRLQDGRGPHVVHLGVEIVLPAEFYLTVNGDKIQTVLRDYKCRFVIRVESGGETVTIDAGVSVFPKLPVISRPVVAPTAKDSNTIRLRNGRRTSRAFAKPYMKKPLSPEERAKQEQEILRALNGSNALVPVTFTNSSELAVNICYGDDPSKMMVQIDAGEKGIPHDGIFEQGKTYFVFASKDNQAVYPSDTVNLPLSFSIFTARKFDYEIPKDATTQPQHYCSEVEIFNGQNQTVCFFCDKYLDWMKRDQVFNVKNMYAIARIEPGKAESFRNRFVKGKVYFACLATGPLFHPLNVPGPLFHPLERAQQRDPVEFKLTDDDQRIFFVVPPSAGEATAVLVQPPQPPPPPPKPRKFWSRQRKTKPKPKQQEPETETSDSLPVPDVEATTTRREAVSDQAQTQQPQPQPPETAAPAPPDSPQNVCWYLTTPTNASPSRAAGNDSDSLEYSLSVNSGYFSEPSIDHSSILADSFFENTPRKPHQPKSPFAAMASPIQTYRSPSMSMSRLDGSNIILESPSYAGLTFSPQAQLQAGQANGSVDGVSSTTTGLPVQTESGQATPAAAADKSNKQGLRINQESTEQEAPTKTPTVTGIRGKTLFETELGTGGENGEQVSEHSSASLPSVGEAPQGATEFEAPPKDSEPSTSTETHGTDRLETELGTGGAKGEQNSSASLPPIRESQPQQDGGTGAGKTATAAPQGEPDGGDDDDDDDDDNSIQDDDGYSVHHDDDAGQLPESPVSKVDGGGDSDSRPEQDQTEMEEPLFARIPPRNDAIELPKPGLCSEESLWEYASWDAGCEIFAQELPRGSPLSRKGLENKGNTCFISASIQVIAHIPLLAQMVLKLSKEAEEKIQQGGDNFPNRLWALLGNIVLDLLLPNRDPKENLNQLIESLPEFGTINGRKGKELVPRAKFERGKQGDSSDFTAEVMTFLDQKLLMDAKINPNKDGWREELPDPRLLETTGISRITTGRMRTRTKGSCGCTSDVYQPLGGIELQCGSKEVVCLKSGVVAFLKPEKLRGDCRWWCSKCKKHVEATKEDEIVTSPPLLRATFKRPFDEETRHKIRKKISFPEEYTLPMKNGTAARYRLIATKNHSGDTVDSGHWCAYVQDPAYPSKWLRKNDGDSTVVATGEVLRETETVEVLYYMKEGWADPGRVEFMGEAAKEGRADRYPSTSGRVKFMGEAAVVELQHSGFTEKEVQRIITNQYLKNEQLNVEIRELSVGIVPSDFYLSRAILKCSRHVQWADHVHCPFLFHLALFGTCETIFADNKQIQQSSDVATKAVEYFKSIAGDGVCRKWCFKIPHDGKFGSLLLILELESLPIENDQTPTESPYDIDDALRGHGPTPTSKSPLRELPFSGEGQIKVTEQKETKEINSVAKKEIEDVTPAKPPNDNDDARPVPEEKGSDLDPSTTAVSEQATAATNDNPAPGAEDKSSSKETVPMEAAGETHGCGESTATGSAKSPSGQAASTTSSSTATAQGKDIEAAIGIQNLKELQEKLERDSIEASPKIKEVVFSSYWIKPGDFDFSCVLGSTKQVRHGVAAVTKLFGRKSENCRVYLGTHYARKIRTDDGSTIASADLDDVKAVTSALQELFRVELRAGRNIRYRFGLAIGPGMLLFIDLQASGDNPKPSESLSYPQWSNARALAHGAAFALWLSKEAKREWRKLFDESRKLFDDDVDFLEWQAKERAKRKTSYVPAPHKRRKLYHVAAMEIRDLNTSSPPAEDQDDLQNHIESRNGIDIVLGDDTTAECPILWLPRRVFSENIVKRVLACQILDNEPLQGLDKTRNFQYREQTITASTNIFPEGYDLSRALRATKRVHRGSRRPYQSIIAHFGPKDGIVPGHPTADPTAEQVMRAAPELFDCILKNCLEEHRPCRRWGFKTASGELLFFYFECLDPGKPDLYPVVQLPASEFGEDIIATSFHNQELTNKTLQGINFRQYESIVDASKDVVFSNYNTRSAIMAIRQVHRHKKTTVTAALFGPTESDGESPDCHMEMTVLTTIALGLFEVVVKNVAKDSVFRSWAFKAGPNDSMLLVLHLQYDDSDAHSNLAAAGANRTDQTATSQERTRGDQMEGPDADYGFPVGTDDHYDPEQDGQADEPTIAPIAAAATSQQEGTPENLNHQDGFPGDSDDQSVPEEGDQANEPTAAAAASEKNGPDNLNGHSASTAPVVPNTANQEYGNNNEEHSNSAQPAATRAIAPSEPIGYPFPPGLTKKQLEDWNKYWEKHHEDKYVADMAKRSVAEPPEDYQFTQSYLRQLWGVFQHFISLSAPPELAWLKRKSDTKFLLSVGLVQWAIPLEVGYGKVVRWEVEYLVLREENGVIVPTKKRKDVNDRPFMSSTLTAWTHRVLSKAAAMTQFKKWLPVRKIDYYKRVTALETCTFRKSWLSPEFELLVEGRLYASETKYGFKYSLKFNSLNVGPVKDYKNGQGQQFTPTFQKTVVDWCLRLRASRFTMNDGRVVSVGGRLWEYHEPLKDNPAEYMQEVDGHECHEKCVQLAVYHYIEDTNDEDRRGRLPTLTRKIRELLSSPVEMSFETKIDRINCLVRDVLQATVEVAKPSEFVDPTESQTNDFLTFSSLLVSGTGHHAATRQSMLYEPTLPRVLTNSKRNMVSMVGQYDGTECIRYQYTIEFPPWKADDNFLKCSQCKQTKDMMTCFSENQQKKKSAGSQNKAKCIACLEGEEQHQSQPAQVGAENNHNNTAQPARNHNPNNAGQRQAHNNSNANVEGRADNNNNATVEGRAVQRNNDNNTNHGHHAGRRDRYDDRREGAYGEGHRGGDNGYPPGNNGYVQRGGGGPPSHPYTGPPPQHHPRNNGHYQHGGHRYNPSSSGRNNEYHSGGNYNSGPHNDTGRRHNDNPGSRHYGPSRGGHDRGGDPHFPGHSDGRSGGNRYNERGGDNYNERGRDNYNERGRNSYNERGYNERGYNERGRDNYNERGYNERGRNSYNERGYNEPGRDNHHSRNPHSSHESGNHYHHRNPNPGGGRGNFHGQYSDGRYHEHHHRHSRGGGNHSDYGNPHSFRGNDNNDHHRDPQSSRRGINRSNGYPRGQGGGGNHHDYGQGGGGWGRGRN